MTIGHYWMGPDGLEAICHPEHWDPVFRYLVPFRHLSLYVYGELVGTGEGGREGTQEALPTRVAMYPVYGPYMTLYDPI